MCATKFISHFILQSCFNKLLHEKRSFHVNVLPIIVKG